jgi:hypothetical protein
MMDVFALGHYCRPSSLHMFFILYHTFLQLFHPSFFYEHAPIVKCSHNNSGFSLVPLSLIDYIDTIAIGASPYPGACIAQFKGLALLVVCL